MNIVSPQRRTPVWAFVLICFLSSAVGLFVGGILGAAISDLAGMPNAIIALTALAGTLGPPAWLIVARTKGEVRADSSHSTDVTGEINQRPAGFTEQEFKGHTSGRAPRDNESIAKNGVYRIIDWWRIGKALLNYLIFLFFGLIFAGAAPQLILTALAVGTVLFICWIAAHLMGVAFDLGGDQLRYPSFIIRRRIPLSDITDANAQVVVRTLLSTLANGIGTGPRSRADRQYAVNLSGDFGTQQVRFASRKRRDQFLSTIRRFAPHAHITRWTGWG